MKLKFSCELKFYCCGVGSPSNGWDLEIFPSPPRIARQLGLVGTFLFFLLLLLFYFISDGN